jgi:hypothetical protein
MAVVLALLLAAAGAHARGDGADGKFEKRESSHFVLFQDVDIDETGGLRGSRRFEQQVLESLEDAYDRLDQYLGLRPPRKLEVEIYDPAVFDRRFAGLFRFAAAGFYAGIIRVRGDDRFTHTLSRVLHHELVHAALHAAAPSAVYPGWVNEGLAEWFEARTHGKRRLSPRELAILARAQEAGQLFSLEALTVPNFGRMSPQAAGLAYLQSYGLMEYLGRRHGERSLREFCVELVRTGDLRRTLRRVYRADLGTLEAGFVSDLG